jgi:hypothetical protein
VRRISFNSKPGVVKSTPRPPFDALSTSAPVREDLRQPHRHVHDFQIANARDNPCGETSWRPAMEGRWGGRVEFRPVEGQLLGQQSRAHSAESTSSKLWYAKIEAGYSSEPPPENTLRNKFCWDWAPRGACVDSGAQPLIFLSGCIAVALVHP